MASIEYFVDRIIEQLDTVVQQETALLKNKASVDLGEFNVRKSQGLYDLSRALSRLHGQVLQPRTVAKLESLRSTLAANQAALSVHLQAVREVADVITAAVRDSESDGTYDPPRSHRSGA